jgi:hypothetical protein
MRGFTRLWSIVFCMSLLIPGYALGSATFTFEHDARVVANNLFTVRVYLNVVSQLPPVHGYQYCLNYDQALIQLEPSLIPCCPTTGPVDGQFFQRDYDNNCTAEGYPTAKNCCNLCAESCVPPDPANVLFIDNAGFNPGELEAECVCWVVDNLPLGPKLVSTLTFRAGPITGPVVFSANPDCTKVWDCDYSDIPPTIVQPPPITILPPSVPAFSGYGIGIFALAITISFILIMRRYRKTRRNVGVLSILLLIGISLGCGMFWCGSAAAGCPDECKPWAAKLDVNHDLFINGADSGLVMKCIKSHCDDLAMDFDGDGKVTQADHDFVLGCVMKGCIKVDQ